MFDRASAALAVLRSSLRWAVRCVPLAAAGILTHCGDNRASSCASPTNVPVRHCPDLSSLAIVPDRAGVGSSVALTATVTSGVDGGTPVISWSASTGKIGDLVAASTTFTCTAIGPAALVVEAAQDGCTEALMGSVDCVASPDAGGGAGADGS